MNQVWAVYIIAGVIGTVVGASELFTRYEDNPRRLFKKVAFWLYIAANGTISAAALLVTRTLGWTVQGVNARDAAPLMAVIAGFGGAMLLRSTFAVVQVGNGRYVKPGPLTAVEAILEAIDRVIDRDQATTRAEAAAKLARNISFDRARISLPMACLTLIEHSSADATDRLASRITKIRDEQMSDAAKAVNLVIALLAFAGPDVVEKAVKALEAEIRVDPGPGPTQSAPPPTGP